MNKFISKGLLFFAILLLPFLIIHYFQKPDLKYYDFLAAIIDKHKQIDSIQSPKIIFAGGSNLAFGIDSKEIQKAVGMPVVNLGLHAGLGMDFILNELKYSIKENDIVVLSPEYFLAMEGKYSWKKITSNYYPTARKFYARNYLMELDFLLEANHKAFIKLFSKGNYTEQNASAAGKDIKVYTRSAFNQNGDVINHLNLPNRKELKGRITFNYEYWEGIEAINQFYQYAKSKKVNVFFVFPTYPVTEYEKNKKAFSLLESDMKKNLQVEILNSPNDVVYADSTFFDTVYHLDKFGRKKRTENMIELFEKNKNIQLCIAKSKEAQTILRP